MPQRVAELSYLESTDATVSRNGLTLWLATESKTFVVDTQEPFRFVFRLERGGKTIDPATVDYVLKVDQAEIIDSGQVELKNGEGSVQAQGSRPCFMHVEITYGDPADGGIRHCCGVGIAPERIEPSMEIPSDFDAFWDRQKARLEGIPFEPVITPIDHDSHPHLHGFSHQELLDLDLSKVEIGDYQLKCLDKPVSGIYTRPRNREAGKHPAMLCVQGAGVFPTRPHNFVAHAEKGYLVFEMNVHGISNLEPEDYYRELAEGPLNKYVTFGRHDRESSYWLGAFLRVKRGLDFLMAQPEWDGRILVIRGSSQGGAQAMAGAYLEPRVTALAASVPAMCDPTRALKGHSFSSHLIEKDDRGRPVPETVETSRYFDCANFMRRMDCEGCFSVGHLDGTCRPSSIFAAYNAFNGRKRMLHQPYSAHANTPTALETIETFVDDHIRRMQAEL